MREWNLKSSDPLCLTLAADARLSQLDYTNDHIWELHLGTSDPGGIVLRTSFGLRARNLRLFPIFEEANKIVTEVTDFDRVPRLRRFAPNFLEVAFSPFAGIDVTLSYWMPDHQTVSGRIRLLNSGVTARKFRLDWVALLNPSGENAKALVPIKKEVINILQGQTSDLYPTAFITGGAQGIASPYPALRHELDLLPGAFRQFTWVQANLPDPEAAFAHARQTATRNFDAEIARIEMLNTNQVEIMTGNPDWDAAFALGQKMAFGLLHSGTSKMQHTSFVSTRLPDQGYSARGDGSDYTHLWNGQTALETWYLSQLLLPGEGEIAEGLLLNFLENQNNDGRIDWKPGLAGQRSNMLATPLLASLAWQIYQHTEDTSFLEYTYPYLLEFVHAWFDDRQDRDGDGIPEWDNPIQSGFEDNPTFARWHTWAQGADITLAESPDLCAMLYNECQMLIKIANVLEREESIVALQAFADNLHRAVQTAWDGRAATYRYWDRESHHSPAGELLKTRQGPGELFLDMVFELPARLMLRLESQDEQPLQTQISVHGVISSGQHTVEKIGRTQLLWLNGLGTATLPNLYADLEHIRIEGLPDNAQAAVQIVDFKAQDHTLLLPLWAKMATQQQANSIIKRKLGKPTQYQRPYGFPACPKPPKDPGAVVTACAWLPWNVMLAEGLLAYGEQQAAADLVSRVMNAITENLKRERAFRRIYHADTGTGLGERNALLGLPPIRLFLETLGIRIISPWKVFIQRFNPFPWPVQLQYRGLTIECLVNETTIIFPDGQSVTIDDPTPCLIDGNARSE